METIEVDTNTNATCLDLLCRYLLYINTYVINITYILKYAYLLIMH